MHDIHTELHVQPLERTLEAALRHKLDRKTKPQGSLGQLEQLALQIGLIQQRLDPQINTPTMLVFAADHGLAEAGVSPYPQAVTAQMVLNFLNGGAAINVLCRTHGLRLQVVDAGVNADLPSHPDLLSQPQGRGTANMLQQPAMTLAQAEAAMRAGAAVVRQHQASGCNLIGFGEMGIGNTSAAALLLARLADLPIADCTGRGTGLDDAGLLRKIDILQQVLQRHPDALSPLAVLATFGGFEIAMMVGAYLAAAQARMTILVDGFITSAALLVASRLQPAVLDYCVFSHCSDEFGHALLLRQLGGTPLLRLGMRLGEGSGAATAYPLLQASVALLNQMASFESAGVSERQDT